MVFECFQAFFTIAGLDHLVAFIFQRIAENIRDQIFVVDYQDGGHRIVIPSLPSGIRDRCSGTGHDCRCMLEGLLQINSVIADDNFHQ
ncbi:hypothetical protein D3C75_1289970 [compost metagenome]